MHLPRTKNLTPKVATLRGQLGPATLRGDHQAADDLRRELRTELLAEHIAREIEKLPPLTDAQRERLAAMLRAGAAA